MVQEAGWDLTRVAGVLGNREFGFGSGDCEVESGTLLPSDFIFGTDFTDYTVFVFAFESGLPDCKGTQSFGGERQGSRAPVKYATPLLNPLRCY